MASRKSYKISRKAAAEIWNAYEWIATRSPNAAESWMEGLIDHLEKMAELPIEFPLAPEARLHNEKIRQSIYGNKRHAYRILFTDDGSCLRIAHVRHAKRDYVKPPGESQEEEPT